MLIQFFLNLKEAKVPVSVREFLTLLEGLKSGVINPSIDEFYQFSRLILVKDEQHFDRFDQVFGSYFNGIEQIIALSPDIPLEWLEKKLQRVLTDEEKAALQKLGGPDALKKRLEELLKEQKNGMAVAINGLAQVVLHHLVTAAITPKASVLVARVPATERPSKSGKLENLRITTVI